MIRRLISKLLHLSIKLVSLFCKERGTILMLHSIEGNQSIYNISLNSFEVLLKWLSDKHVIDLEKWEDENDFYALTIDDVPHNFYQYAYPLLKKYAIPFTIFVNTSLLDKKGYLSTSELIELSECPHCTIGSHGVSHSYFYKMSSAEAESDLASSKEILEKVTKQNVNMFAFPYGSYFACGLRNKSRVLDYYKYGFSAIEIPVSKAKILPNYFIPRVNVTEELIKNLKI